MDENGPDLKKNLILQLVCIHRKIEIKSLKLEFEYVKQIDLHKKYQQRSNRTFLAQKFVKKSKKNLEKLEKLLL